MASCPQKIFLLACGSFNPITNMHLRLFELARDFLQRDGNFSVVGGALSPTNDGYKKKGLLPSLHRVKMCQLATQSSDWIKCSSWESEQSEWLQTIKVITRFQTAITSGDLEGNIDKEARVKLLCGADLLESFAVPNLWSDNDIETIVGQHGLIVITRTGSSPETFIDNHQLLTKYKNNIKIVEEYIPNEISATKIRLALSRHESIRYLTPDPVVEYIEKNDLYR